MCIFFGIFISILPGNKRDNLEETEFKEEKFGIFITNEIRNEDRRKFKKETTKRHINNIENKERLEISK